MAGREIEFASISFDVVVYALGFGDENVTKIGAKHPGLVPFTFIGMNVTWKGL